MSPTGRYKSLVGEDSAMIPTGRDVGRGTHPAHRRWPGRSPQTIPGPLRHQTTGRVTTPYGRAVARSGKGVAGGALLLDNVAQMGGKRKKKSGARTQAKKKNKNKK